MTSYFIAGTGTGVGKTFTTCALIHGARAKGAFVRGYKPIISGWDGSDAMDTMQIIAAGEGVQTIDEVSPWRYAAPLAPNRAALKEGKTLTLDELNCWLRKQTDISDTRPALIETAGGTMSPLTSDALVIDWMESNALPFILVGGSYLGSISHVFTALHRFLPRLPAAVIINETAGSTVPFKEVVETLDSYISNIPLRIYQPLVSSYKEATEIHRMVSWL